MERTEKIANLRELLKPIIENHSAFLVDLSLGGDHRRPILEVYCETEIGISIDKCAEISKEILPIVDSSGIIGNNFRLEVSSPGVGVPLKDQRQFRRNVGRLMSVKYHGSLSGRLIGTELKMIEGDLIETKEDAIVIKTEAGPVEVGFDSIDEAIVKIRW